jgi:hypothetical protein
MASLLRHVATEQRLVLWRAPDVSVQLSQETSAGNLVDNIVRSWLFGRPPYLGDTLMKYVIHRQESFPDDVGHWRCSLALGVLLDTVSAWLLVKELTNTFGKTRPHLCQYESRPGVVTRDRGCPKRPRTFVNGERYKAIVIARFTRAANYLVMFRGTAGRRWVRNARLEPKRKRLGVNKGTRETRLSMVVTPLARSADRTKHLPMRRSSGGAPVVVGDVSDVHMAKGCRRIRGWIAKRFFNLEASR